MDILDQLTAKASSKGALKNQNSNQKNKSLLDELINLSESPINTRSNKSFNNTKHIRKNNLSEDTYGNQDKTIQANMSHQPYRKQQNDIQSRRASFLTNKNNVSISQFPDLSSNYINSEAESTFEPKWTESFMHMGDHLTHNKKSSCIPSRQSLGVIMSDEGEQMEADGRQREDNSITNNFSFHKNNSEWKRIQNSNNKSGYLTMTQTQSKIISNNNNKNRQRIQQFEYNDNFRSQITRLQQKADKLQAEVRCLENKNEEYKQQIQLLKKQKQQEVNLLKIRHEEEITRKIKGLIREYQEQKVNSQERTKKMHEQQIKAKQEIYLWQISHLKQTYSIQIQTLKQNIQVYKSLINNNSLPSPITNPQQSKQKEKLYSYETPAQHSSKLRELNDLYEKFYQQKLENDEKLDREYRELHKKREEHLARISKQERQISEMLYKRESELRQKEYSLQMREMRVKKKQEELRLQEDTINAKEKQMVKYYEKMDALMKQSKKEIMEEKNRMIEKQAQLFRKIRVVQMYRHQQCKQIDDTYAQSPESPSYQYPKTASQTLLKPIEPQKQNMAPIKDQNRSHETSMQKLPQKENPKQPTQKSINSSKNLNNKSSLKLTNYLKSLKQSRNRTGVPKK